MTPPRIAVDTDAEIAPWRQVHDQLATLVDAGDLAPGVRLPAIRRLARDLAVAPGTVARAYRELEGGGRVRTARGGGTTVTGPGPTRLSGEPDALPRLARRYLADAAALGADATAALAAVRAVRGSADALTGPAPAG